MSRTKSTQTSARGLSGGCSQRQSMPQSAAWPALAGHTIVRYRPPCCWYRLRPACGARRDGRGATRVPAGAGRGGAARGAAAAAAAALLRRGARSGGAGTGVG
eukprot:scaffold132642_cov63-Phaeocystis_antarctica.AAC.1